MNNPVRSSGNDVIRDHNPAGVEHCINADRYIQPLQGLELVSYLSVGFTYGYSHISPSGCSDSRFIFSCDCRRNCKPRSKRKYIRLPKLQLQSLNKSQSYMKLLALLFLPIFSFAQIKLDKKISLLNNKVEILAPKELSNMTDELWHIKYHNNPRTTVALSDENGEINLLIDDTQQPVAPYQLGDYKEFDIKSLKEKRRDVKI